MRGIVTHLDLLDWCLKEINAGRKNGYCEEVHSRSVVTVKDLAEAFKPAIRTLTREARVYRYDNGDGPMADIALKPGTRILDLSHNPVVPRAVRRFFAQCGAPLGIQNLASDIFEMEGPCPEKAREALSNLKIDAVRYLRERWVHTPPICGGADGLILLNTSAIDTNHAAAFARNPDSARAGAVAHERWVSCENFAEEQ